MATITLNSAGTARAHVTNSMEIEQAVAEFAALVQEAVLIDGREFELSLSFNAYERREGDSILNPLSEAF